MSAGSGESSLSAFVSSPSMQAHFIGSIACERCLHSCVCVFKKDSIMNGGGIMYHEGG